MDIQLYNSALYNFLLKILESLFDFLIKDPNCLKFKGCKGSTADFDGLGCVSIISPSAPAAIEA